MSSDFLLPYQDPSVEVPFQRTMWNYDRMAASDESALVFDPDEDMTQQQFKEESDINEIVRRFGLTGQVPDGINMPMSGDFSEMVTDFKTAADMVRQSQEAFMELPAEVRARFYNDPQKLLDFMEDGRNRDEAVRLGILKAPPEQVPLGSPSPSGPAPAPAPVPAPSGGAKS